MGWWCRTQTSVVMMSVKSHITMKSFTPAYHLNLIIYWKLSSTAKASSDWGFLFKLCSTENWYLILWWNNLLLHCLLFDVRESKEQYKNENDFWVSPFELFAKRRIYRKLNPKITEVISINNSERKIKKIVYKMSREIFLVTKLL